MYNCGTLTRFFALAKKNSDDITFYLHGITRKTKFSQHMRDYFKKVVYFPGSSNNCATVVKYSFAGHEVIGGRLFLIFFD